MAKHSAEVIDYAIRCGSGDHRPAMAPIEAVLTFGRDDKVLLARCDIVPRLIIGQCHGGDAKSHGEKIALFGQREAAAHSRNSRTHWQAETRVPVQESTLPDP